MLKFLSIFFLVCSAHVQAMDVWVGGNGVSGMPVTPTATMATGSLIYQLQNRVIGDVRTEGTNHSFAVGLSSFSELGLRTADTTFGRNTYAVGGGIRDLSASAKVQLNPLFGYSQSDLKLAAGVTDYGGAYTVFRSFYGVATYDQPSWSVTTGFAKAVSREDFNPLKGIFASAAIKATPWLSLRAEANQRHAWAGLTVSNQSLLAKINAPAGASLYLNLDKQWRGSPISGGRPWLGVGINFPLDWSQAGPYLKPQAGTDAKREMLVEAVPLAMRTFDEHPANSQPSKFEALTELSQLTSKPELKALPELENASVFQSVAISFAKMGFEAISVGTRRGEVVIQFSDFIFDHGSLDGSGVALGLISQAEKLLASNDLHQYHLIYAKWGTPSIAFEGRIACLTEWLKDLSCSAQESVSASFRNLESNLKDVAWQVRNHNPYQYRPRVLINPIYSYYWATEYSLIDYSLGLNIKPYLHLWNGGALEFSRSEHLQSSQEFQPGRFYSYTRIPSANRRMMLHHMQKLQDGFSARLSVGQMYAGPHRGGQLALRWDSLSGEWATGLNASHWKAMNEGPNNQGIPSGSPRVMFARYAPQGRDWNLEVQAGHYWYKDKGLSVISTHWFGDMNFSYYLKRSMPPTQFWPGQRGVTLAGIELSFPFTPRKAMDADTFQIKGVNRTNVGLVTPIGRPDNYIVGSNGVPIYIKALVDTPVPEFMASVLFDSDRAHAGYVNAHLGRLRYAYQRWVVQSK
jgi:hypothetical protein